jgi:hypothetical protein
MWAHMDAGRDHGILQLNVLFQSCAVIETNMVVQKWAKCFRLHKTRLGSGRVL